MSANREHDLRYFVWRQLQSSEVIGDVLQFALFVESALNALLVDYFVPSERRKAFEQLVLRRLSFHEKLEIFTRFKLRRPLRSHANLNSTFQSARKLRNYVAHSYSYEEASVQKLATDKNILRWLRGFPEALEKERRAVGNRIAALKRAKKVFTSSWEDEFGDEIPF